MGWNRPSENKVEVEGKGRQRNGRLKGLIAGAIVVLGAGIAAWWLWPEEETQDATPAKRGLIREVAPAKAPKLSQAQTLKKRYPELEIPDDWNKPYPPQAYWPDGRLKQYSRYVKVITNEVASFYTSPEQKVFPEGGANLKIAELLANEPGDLVVGDWDAGKNFTKKFLESLKTPIVVSPEDDDFAKELKKAVIETKVELKDRLDAGEDLRKVMNDAREEMRQLYLYREEIKDMIRKVRKEGKDTITPEDLKDLYGAANQMLKDRGITREIALPSMLIRQMKVKEAERKGTAK